MNEKQARDIAGLGATIQREGGVWYKYTDGVREEVKAVKVTATPRKRGNKKEASK